MAMGPNGLGEGLAGGTLDRLLAGGVDVGHEEKVGLVERAREFVEEKLRAGVAVGLERDDDTSIEATLRGIESRLDLRRVVPVVVHDHHVAALAALLADGLPEDGESSLYPVEA